jgi:hypothetical protein
VRLPDICWTCACTVVDPHDNEWVTYVDVEASTKDEAERKARMVCGGRGLAAMHVFAQACPERKTKGEGSTPLALPPPPPEDVEPFFEKVFFTRYVSTTREAGGAA